MPTVQFTNIPDLTAIVAHFDQHPNAQLFLVHDQGIYLMPASPTFKNETTKEGSNWVTYAKDCNPDTDEEWYDNTRHLVGGDDFGENVTASINVIRTCAKEGKTFSIRIAPTSLTFGVGRKVKA